MNSRYILPDTFVKMYRYGNKLEVTNSCGNPHPIRKLSETHYLDANGIIREYNLSENRSQNLTSMKRSMKRLGRIVENNFFGNPNEIWLTLTYAENQRDLTKVYNNFKYFIQKLRDFVPERYGKLEYVYAIEPQERGAWHIHALIKSENMVYLYIPHKDIERLWNRGFVSVRKIQPKDNIAAYLNAYLTNLKVGEGNDKAFIKGGRLHLYPRKCRFYRLSKGIRRPLEFKGKKETLWEYLRVANAITAPDKVYRYEINTSYGSTVNVFREFYNLKEWIKNESDAS